jgi:dihydroorotate dehydrogenase (NAD+) catalytic subunit
VEIGSYFAALASDLAHGQADSDKNVSRDLGNRAESMVRYDIDMSFTPVTLVSNERVCEDIALLTFDRKINVQAGEFVYLWLPGVGEKPFSALVDDPFTLVVIDVGQFTHALMDLPPGTEAYVRGPHGVPVAPPENARIMAIAGGTGLAAVYQLARDFGNAEVFAGARSAERLYFVDECAEVADLHIATDDGSRGFKGRVTELLRERLEGMSKAERDACFFYNCGPEPMVRAAIAVQREFVAEEQIFSAVDYLTKCGVGICGACATPDGRRICVDGPFVTHLDP